MPAPNTAKWPRPKSEDEWEDMALDALRIRWRDQNAARNGRRGQRQDGVDIFGSKACGTVGAQAKNMDSLALADALTEISKAESFSPKLQEYYFVLGGPRDATLQQVVRELTKSRATQGLFPVYALFFEDVALELAGNEEMVMKYWGHFVKDLGLALRSEVKQPVLDEDAAVDRIIGNDQFKRMTEYFQSVTDPNLRLSVMVEHVPDLSAPKGDMGRYWHMAIGESRPKKTLFLQRIAISVEGDDVRVLRITDQTWLTPEEWNAEAEKR
jgi:hypothetical protein